MASASLFLDRPLQFEGEEKLAGSLTRLSDNVEMWPREITQEAYRQIPYISDFDINVVLDKVDEQKGFAFGSIEVKAKSEMTMEERKGGDLPRVHVPIVVKDQMLYPLDVFLNGKSYAYLTEPRLRSALFRPETMDAARTRPYDPSLVHDLQPPIRAGYGGFGAGGVKTGSAASDELEHLPILPMLQGRVLGDHVTRLKVACQDPSLRSQVLGGSLGVRAAFNSALGLKETSQEKWASSIRNSVVPKVVQLKKHGSNSLLLKTADPDFYAPEIEIIPESLARDLAGEEDISGIMESDGTMTVSPDTPVKSTLEAEEIRVADSFGLWKVQDLSGNTLIGWVFPQLLSMDMQPLPLSLFNNGSQHAVQEHVAGEMAGKSTDLPKGHPQGYGCLYFIDHGTAKAFVPMRVTSTMRGPDGLIRYVAEDDMGAHFTFYFSDAVKTILRVGGSEYCIPSQVSWMPLRGKTELVNTPAYFSKVASDRFLSNRAELVGDGNLFSWRGPAVSKLASADRAFLNRDDALFLGVSLGIDPSFCKEALDRASKGELLKFGSVRVITPTWEKLAKAHESVKAELASIPRPIRNYFLAKEAALLDDALTADKILGLGFLTAENISTFVDMIPALEAASSKVAEMLVAARIGLRDVPEVALERMLAALEDVIQGLKSLKQKETSRFSI
jgi:hypothetical protein